VGGLQQWLVVARSDLDPPGGHARVSAERGHYREWGLYQPGRGRPGIMSDQSGVLTVAWKGENTVSGNIWYVVWKGQNNGLWELKITFEGTYFNLSFGEVPGMGPL
jgi:hypothetical protein